MTNVAPPLIDFSPLGDLYNTYRQGQQQRQTAEWLQGQGLPQNLSLAQLALANKRDERNFGFQQQEALRAQGNTDRSFQLQKEQADAAARGFDYREVERDGVKEFIRTNKATGVSEVVPISGATTAPSNPFQQGKMNESQSKDALYTSRMIGAEKVLRTIDAEVATSAMNKLSGVVSDKIGINVRPAEYQKFDQARRDFVNATLRRESGAVISEQEFANANQQYFPQPGDTPDLLKQKRQNRIEAIRGIGAGAGPGYKPEMTIDASGELVPNPGAQAKPQASTWKNKETITAARANPQAALAEAKAAIAAGKDPAMIKQRLQQVLGSGADLSGL